MPPWPADPEYVHFRDEKVLNKDEIDLFKNEYSYPIVNIDETKNKNFYNIKFIFSFGE